MYDDAIRPSIVVGWGKGPVNEGVVKLDLDWSLRSGTHCYFLSQANPK
jgi:hypothetical protein